ncbi:MAG: protease pro-enzyme activation domain-containing protein, partial [Steroidobacteraceae bacterium]
MNPAIARPMSSVLRVSSSLFLAILACAFMLTEARAQSVSTVHMRAVVRDAVVREVGRLPATQVLSLDVVLNVRDRAALDAFVADVADPLSFYYRHYLSVQEFTDRFGPTESDYAAVVRYATDHGLTVTGGTRDGMEVQVRGPVSAIESAFHVTLHLYPHPTENRTFYAPDQEPSTTLAFALWHISGLDNYS